LGDIVPEAERSGRQEGLYSKKKNRVMFLKEEKLLKLLGIQE